MKSVNLLLSVVIVMAASGCGEDPQPIRPVEYSFWVQPVVRAQECTVRWGADALQDVDHTRGGIGFGSSVTVRHGQRMAFQVTVDALIDVTKNYSPRDSTHTFAIKAGEVLKLDQW